MQTGNEESLQIRDATDGAEKSLFKREALSGAMVNSSNSQDNLILEFIKQLNGNGLFSTINNGETAVEGVLLTTSPFDWVIGKLHAFCHERLLRCDVESRGPHLSVAIIGDRNGQCVGELHLFTSQYGDFAGIKFPI
jgi:hypothetical protein